MPPKPKKSRSRIKDPQAEREAQKYENPIPSREAILLLLEQQGQALTEQQIGHHLFLKAKDEEAIQRRLGAMVRDGQLIRNRKGEYGVAAKMDLKAGRILAHADGFGFFRPDEGGEDVFLSPKQMRKVLHNDRVLVAVTGVDRRGRLEGAIVEILEHVNRQLVGRFEQDQGIAFVLPDDKRINQDVFIPSDAYGKARSGDLVLVELTRQPDKNRKPMGRVIEVVGLPGDPGMAVELSILSHDLPMGFPDEVISESENLPNEVAESSWAGRQDLRDLPLVTIDGADARDFDDAVYCQEEGEGWCLWVAIADVSNYVEVASALDDEAFQRATSAYFPNKVVPMLPEKLSNGLCSLNPDVDRLCMVCEMEVDRKGGVNDWKFYPAVMRSKARLTYDQVDDLIHDRHTTGGNPAKSQSHALNTLHHLYQAFASARSRRGALDFESQEVQCVFDEAGHLEDLVPTERNVAHRMIEECMIAANVSAAKFLEKHNMPTPFRSHDTPPASKLEDLATFLRSTGISFPSGLTEITPLDFAAVQDQAHDREDKRLIEMVLLRSQSLAVYSTKNIGHFGLGLSHYAHFTSPIRRYADLLVHRAIYWVLSGQSPKAYTYSLDQMDRMAEHCSQQDRNAEDASREAVDRLKCIYMKEKIGNVYEGQVTGVTSFGLFVELDETRVNGLVHVTALNNDYYHFDAVKHSLTGERGGKVYRLGDRLKIQVSRVDLEDRKIDFVLAE